MDSVSTDSRDQTKDRPRRRELRNLVAAWAVLSVAALAPMASAATVQGYSGNLSAAAIADRVQSNPAPVLVLSSDPDNYGSYTATASALFLDPPDLPCGFGACARADATGTATVGADGFTASFDAGASRNFSQISAFSSASMSLGFMLQDAADLALTINARGNYLVSLFSVGSSTPLYNLDDGTFVGGSFDGVVPLSLQAGAYQLFVMSSHFESMAGVISAGWLDLRADFTPGTAAVPVPAALWLLISAIGGLGAGSRLKGPRRRLMLAV